MIIPDRKSQIIAWAILGAAVLWFALAFAQATAESTSFAETLSVLSGLMAEPLTVHWTRNSAKCLFLTILIYPCAVAYYMFDHADRRPGKEHGSAKWGSVSALRRKYRNKKNPEQNTILTQNVQLGMDEFRHRHNQNMVVVGGSGTGKTRFLIEPNILQCNRSLFILDPKGELLRETGYFFEQKGVGISVIDLVHFKGHYNPMAYVETDEDAVKLAHAIVYNTKEQAVSNGNDKFWDDSAVMLISALILYLVYEAPENEKNLNTLMYLIQNFKVSDEPDATNPLTMLFEDLERRDPMHPAVMQYKSFMIGSETTIKSVLITASANLFMFNNRQFANMTNSDEMFLPELGKQQRVIYCIIPDNDKTFNFLISILYTQLFDQLFRLADSNPEYHGRMPMPVQVLMDEFANVAVPDNFKNILAVCRSRAISIVIVLQSIAQLKAMYKDDWEGIIGNCDSFLYLGGNEYGTFEYLSKILGKETQRTTSQSIGRGGHGSSSDSIQSAGRELATPDEIRRLDNSKAILLIRSEDPVIDYKFDLMKHPNSKYLASCDGKPYIIPYDYMQNAFTFKLSDLEDVEIPKEILQQFELINLEEL